jgi:hypothetical protein
MYVIMVGDERTCLKPGYNNERQLTDECLLGMRQTSVLSNTLKHFIISSKLLLSTSVKVFLFPPLPTSPPNNPPSVSSPLSSTTNCSIQIKFAVDKCTLREIRCLTSLTSVVLYDIKPSTYHRGVFSPVESLRVCPEPEDVPPEEAHQLDHNPPVV